MMMRANQRASAAGQRADALGETLATFADATPEAEDAAQAAEKALAVLNERVAAALPRDRRRAPGPGGRRRPSWSGWSGNGPRWPRCASRTAPPPWTRDLADARAALEQARTAERLAEEADRAARQALADGPQRAPLELARAAPPGTAAGARRGGRR